MNPPMLVEEFQHQHELMQNQQRRLAAQSSEIRDLKEQMAKLQTLTETIQTALAEVQRRATSVAMR